MARPRQIRPSRRTPSTRLPCPQLRCASPPPPGSHPTSWWHLGRTFQQIWCPHQASIGPIALRTLCPTQSPARPPHAIICHPCLPHHLARYPRRLHHHPYRHCCFRLRGQCPPSFQHQPHRVTERAPPLAPSPIPRLPPLGPSPPSSTSFPFHLGLRGRPPSRSIPSRLQ